jgi:hypothetical protein
VFRARTVRTALQLARSPGAGLVVVRLGNPSSLRYLQGAKNGRIVGLVQLPKRLDSTPTAWRKAIALATRDGSLDLAVVPRTAKAGLSLISYLDLVQRVAPSAEPIGVGTRPGAPGRLRVTDARATSVTVAWEPSADEDRIAEYGVYVGNRLVGRSVNTHAPIIGLRCGGRYVFYVDAVDEAGHRSPKAAIQVFTRRCRFIQRDVKPPSAPADVSGRSATTTTVSIGWTGSQDDVGVAGYDVFVEGAYAGTTRTNEYTIDDLACDETYEVGVEAFDRAGNRSERGVGSASTSACSTPQDASPPEKQKLK